MSLSCVNFIFGHDCSSVPLSPVLQDLFDAENEGTAHHEGFTCLYSSGGDSPMAFGVIVGPRLMEGDSNPDVFQQWVLTPDVEARYAERLAALPPAA
jgi:hypothetical protein